MLSLSTACRYYLYANETDMRKGFDSLSALVRDELGKDPLNGDVFIFLNRHCTHVKLLQWDKDGFALYWKRLERGTFERPTKGRIELSSRELMLILQGVSLRSVHLRNRYTHPQTPQNAWEKASYYQHL